MSVAFSVTKALLPRTPNAPNDMDVYTLTYQTSGILVPIIIATISLIAVAGLLTAIAASAWNMRKSPYQNLFVRTNIAPYFIMLLLSNFLQSIAGMMSSRWVHLERIEPGPFCTSQGVLKHFSSVCVAVWSLIIAIHTFRVLFFRVSIERWITYTTVVVANVLLVLLACIGFVIGHAPGNGPFYGVAGYWCWITDEYKGLRILLEYLIMYLSASTSFILYLLVFFRMRGNITVNGRCIRFRMNTNGGMRREYTANIALRVAKQMLLYPVVYTFLILPLAVVRSYGWSSRGVSYKLVLFSDAVFQAAGLVNVILFTTTRRLLPWRSVLPWNQAVQSSSEFTPQRTFPVLTYRHIFLHPVSQENETEKGEMAEEPTSGESPSHHVKIDNHIDNMLIYSSRLDSSQIDVPRPPPPATLRPDRS